MKKLLIVSALLSVASLSLAWERRGPDVVFETRPLGVSVVEPMTTKTIVSEPMVVESEPVVVETYPTYYKEYRPVRGVVEGAATAAEGVVEGAAEAVRSVIP